MNTQKRQKVKILSSRAVCLIIIVLSCNSCQKTYNDAHTKDEVIIEFAARLEEQSPKYQYDHSRKLPNESAKKTTIHGN